MTHTRTIKGFLAALSLVLVAFTGGCLPKPFSVPVTYVPASNAMPISGASSVHVFVVGEDQRANKIAVGQYYGQQAIVTSNDVADAARDAVQEELAARGFVIGAGPTSLEVRVQMLRFRNSFDPAFFDGTFHAEMIMHVQVERPGKVITYSQNFDVTDSIDATDSTGSGYSDVLNGALKKGITQLFEDPAFKEALLPPKPLQPSTNPQNHGAKS